MVCLGNICRSPLAQGIMEHKLIEKDLAWQVDSAGTSSFHIGSKPDPRSILVAKKNGIDISSQRARQFRQSDFANFDLILAMDSTNYTNLLNMAQSEEEKAKVKLIMNFSYPDENRAVPDPYWDDDGFDKVYAMLDDACTNIINKKTPKQVNN